MSLESNKALLRKHFEEIINKKNLSFIDTDVAPDFIDHGALPGSPKGLDGAKQWISYLYKMVPDIQVEIEDVIAEGDKVVVRCFWHGTHTQPYLDISPTGKKFCFQEIVIWKVQDGKLKERWAAIDFGAIKKQLE